MADLIQGISYKQLRRVSMGDHPGGAARGSRCGRARNLTPGYNDLLGRRPDIGE